tara:strand:+ start:602 stop:733 length:132 start_codon:yes stop_codon:yes gene_type:complete
MPLVMLQADIVKASQEYPSPKKPGGTAVGVIPAVREGVGICSK